MASCSRAPDMLIERTKAACPASKIMPLAACSKSASSTIPPSTVRPSVRSASATSRCSAARMRAEVNRSEPATVYMRPVAAAQGRRFGDRFVGPRQRYRSGVEDLCDDTVDQLIDPSGGDLSGLRLALRLGADMPALPGRAALLQHSQHQAR